MGERAIDRAYAIKMFNIKNALFKVAIQKD